ncbi:unnamed protein product [Ectocarpus fasciculatus]
MRDPAKTLLECKFTAVAQAHTITIRGSTCHHVYPAHTGGWAEVFQDPRCLFVTGKYSGKRPLLCDAARFGRYLFLLPKRNKRRLVLSHGRVRDKDRGSLTPLLFFSRFARIV